MTLTIDLSKDEEAQLVSVAAQHGRDLQAYAHAVLLKELSSAKMASAFVSPTETVNARRTANMALETALNTWLQNDATSDPNEIAQAQADLDVWKQTLNENRAEGGERLLFP